MAFVRYAVHLGIVVAIGLAAVERLWVTTNLGVLSLRAVALLGSTLLNFVAVFYLPLTMTSALMFSAPLWICLLSIPLLGEEVGWRRWVAMMVGFGGILIVARPWTGQLHWAVFLSLGAALCASLYAILTRRLAGRDPTNTQQFYVGLISTIGMAPLALVDWAWPQGTASWLAFGLIGCFGWVGHQLLTIAHRFAPASTLAPFSYFQIVYMTASSWLIFAQPPDRWVIVGAGVVAASGIYIWLRERALVGADRENGMSGTVLVTGASQGIGAATAAAFARAGWRVALAARRADALDTVAAGLAGEGHLPIACDVTDPEAVDRLFARIAAEGRVDAVFNNAGASMPATLTGDVGWDDWRRLVSVNLDGAFLIARGAFRAMRAQSPQGGRIINNGSISATRRATGRPPIPLPSTRSLA